MTRVGCHSHAPAKQPVLTSGLHLHSVGLYLMASPPTSTASSTFACFRWYSLRSGALPSSVLRSHGYLLSVALLQVALCVRCYRDAPSLSWWLWHTHPLPGYKLYVLPGRVATSTRSGDTYLTPHVTWKPQVFGDVVYTWGTSHRRSSLRDFRRRLVPRIHYVTEHAYDLADVAPSGAPPSRSSRATYTGAAQLEVTATN